MRVSFNGAGFNFSKVTIWVRIPAPVLVGGNRTETILRPYDDRPSHMEAANHIQRSRVQATQEPHKLRHVGSNPASALSCRVSCQGREPAVLKNCCLQRFTVQGKVSGISDASCQTLQSTVRRERGHSASTVAMEVPDLSLEKPPESENERPPRLTKLGCGEDKARRAETPLDQCGSPL